MSTIAPVAFVLKGYPRLSETFIAQEIRALERRGLDIRLVSLRHPTDPSIHPIHREITAPVTYLPEYLSDEPGRVARAWRVAGRWPGFARAFSAWCRDLRRDPSRNRIRRFGQACVLAHELPPEVRWLHAHFLHTPASVTRYAALMRDLPWSVSAHAKDVWTIPGWEKGEKLRSCRWCVACSRHAAKHLAGVASSSAGDDGSTAAKVELVYHGLDLERFPPPPGACSRRDGSRRDQPVRILSVGRLVEKKGYDLLSQALARLPEALSWQLVHIGGGPLAANLQRQASQAGLAPHISWMGPQPQDIVLEHYRKSDVFVLASRIAGDGDRDGLPNVLMEAQSQRVACLSTRVSAIPELIIDNVTGLLVPPEDPAALALALERLIREPDLRAHLGTAGLNRLRSRFSMEAGIDRLLRLFEAGGIGATGRPRSGGAADLTAPKCAPKSAPDSAPKSAPKSALEAAME